MNLSNITVGVGPIGGKIFIARVSKTGIAIVKREATDEVLFAVCKYLLHDSAKGSDVRFSDKLTGKSWTLSIRPNRFTGMTVHRNTKTPSDNHERKTPITERSPSNRRTPRTSKRARTSANPGKGRGQRAKARP